MMLLVLQLDQCQEEEIEYVFILDELIDFEARLYLARFQADYIAIILGFFYGRLGDRHSGDVGCEAVVLSRRCSGREISFK